MGIIVLSIFALAAAAAGPAVPEKGADAAAGRTIFAAKCTTCHAKDAKGNPALAKMYKLDPDKLNLLSADARKMTAADQVKIVTDGKDKMKPYKDKLSTAEIAGVVAYIRSLGAEPAPK